MCHRKTGNIGGSQNGIILPYIFVVSLIQGEKGMKYNTIAVVSLVMLLAGTLQAAEQRGALILYKEPLIEFAGPKQSGCEVVYDVKTEENVSDMRDFRNFFCEGRYTLTLDGEKGTTVSLFGKFKYKKEAGFMVVVKNDDRKIWLINFEDISPGKWVNVKAKRDSGAYSVYYKSKALFSQNISSIKWGKWWQGDTPK